MPNVRSITPNDPADFTPELGNYKTLQPFRYWCQKVLPLVYDDSLSYYEVLCKVVDYINKLIDDENKYVYAICNKYISDCTEDEEHSKKIKLILRFTIYVGTYKHNLGKTEISFDYATGGSSGREVNSKEDIEKIVRQNLRCHSLYTYEELDKLKKENEIQTLFDFI